MGGCNWWQNCHTASKSSRRRSSPRGRRGPIAHSRNSGVSRSAQSWIILRRPRGGAMRQRGLALSFLAIAAAAFVTLSAQATPLPVPPETYSSVEKIGCRGPGAYCPAGRHWVCDLFRCRCAPCAYGGRRPYWGQARMPPSAGPSVSGAPRAAAIHYVVLDEAGHCTVVDSKPEL